MWGIKFYCEGKGSGSYYVRVSLGLHSLAYLNKCSISHIVLPRKKKGWYASAPVPFFSPKSNDLMLKGLLF